MDLTILNLKNTSLDRSKLLTFSVLYGRKEWAKLSEFMSLGRMCYSVHARATCLFPRLGLLAQFFIVENGYQMGPRSSGKNWEGGPWMNWKLYQLDLHSWKRKLCSNFTVLLGIFKNCLISLVNYDNQREGRKFGENEQDMILGIQLLCAGVALRFKWELVALQFTKYNSLYK